MKILVVDDDPDTLMLAGEALSLDPRFKVKTALGGSEALDAARRDRPEACLIDYRMANMDGLELMRKLRALPGMKTLPVVFCSAKRAPGMQALFLSSGAQGVIPKPFNAATLADDLARMVGLSSPEA